MCGPANGVIMASQHRASQSSATTSLALALDVKKCTSTAPALIALRDKLCGLQQQQLDAAAVKATAAAAAATATAGPTPAGKQGGLTQTSMRTGLQRMNKEEVDDKVAAFFYANGIAFYASRSLEYTEMVAAIARHGASYTAPKYDVLRTTLLDRAGARCEAKGVAFLAKEHKGGFTICYDGWTDAASRALLNLLVATPSGSLFLDAVDTNGKLKDAEYVAGVIIMAIEKVGAANVVAVVTDNAPVCKAAGDIIELRYPHITKLPCVAHVMDLILEDICSLPPFKNLIKRARKVTMFLKNHGTALHMYRKEAARLDLKLELLQPGLTRFASSIIMTERLVTVKRVLRALMANPEWRTWAKQTQYKPKASAIKHLLQGKEFWTQLKELNIIITCI